jgi:SAM-dependent methyltransferase
MEFSPFDKRGYATLRVRDGYAEWAGTYEQTVLDLMDLRLLARLRTVDWAGGGRVLDLACGTGRGGIWMRRAGVQRIEGIDLTEPMLAQARAKGVYDRLSLGDVRATGLEGGAYRLITQLLADEHMADLAPLYREVARLLAPGGQFVIVGYHPHFLMMGIATHFDRASGESVAIESHVHLASDHVAAAHAVGLQLVEMVEGLVDDDWIAAKPKWEKYRHHPVTYAMVWRKP